ncbi:MAG TPA: lipid-A-disaccharide synthase [Bacteroidales bacterium]|nr:lipid-A-disaccharide synthase [Bacteroidales bacterium]
MRYFILAGEPSGDLHGSNLIRSLLKADPDAVIECWGGDLMSAAGGTLLKHYRETAFMGAWEVLVNIRSVITNFDVCRRQIAEFKPDVTILIDYPGFNLRIAKYVKGLGIKVYYYISPKFWAWRESRVKLVKKYVDRMYIIFPFEVEFYRNHGYEAHYLGNPLIDQTETFRNEVSDNKSLRETLGLDERPVVALLSGSRQQEVKHILPEMIKVAGSFPDYQFVVAAVSHLPAELYSGITGSFPVKTVTGKTYELLSVAEASLVTSGTATLEAALFDVPQVVCYKTSAFTYKLSMMFLKVRFISLVNLIMDREIVKELIQDDLNEITLHRELSLILRSGYKHSTMRENYSVLRFEMGGGGASSRVAGDIIFSLKGSQARL